MLKLICSLISFCLVMGNGIVDPGGNLRLFDLFFDNLFRCDWMLASPHNQILSLQNLSSSALFLTCTQLCNSCLEIFAFFVQSFYKRCQVPSFLSKIVPFSSHLIISISC